MEISGLILFCSRNLSLRPAPKFHLPHLPAVGVSDKTHISYPVTTKRHYRRNNTLQCYQSIRIVEFVEQELNENEISKYFKSAITRINTDVLPYFKKSKNRKILSPGFVFSARLQCFICRFVETI